MAEEAIYESMIQPKGLAYRPDQIDRHSLYNTPIDTSPGRLAGNSRIHGDASPEVQSRVIDELIKASQRGGLDAHETAYVLAMARAESGFNPDAAAGTTSAYGLGQFVKDTGAAYGIDASNRDDVTKQAEALVAHYKDNASIARSRGVGEEYIYKYHHDGPASDYGGLELARKHIIPYVNQYESFVAEHEKKHGVLPVDPTFDVRNHHTPGESRTHPSGNVLRQGAHGDDVRELQSQLNRLGYTGSDGAALEEDRRFGAETKVAVESFQRERGLHVDGVVGSETRKAIEEQLQSLAHDRREDSYEWRCPLRLDDPTHPDHAFYLKTRDLVYGLDRQNGRTPDERSDQLASAITVQARSDGLQRIDQVALSEDASALWGAQRPPGARDHFFDKHCQVDTVQALNMPMEQSGAQWPQAMQQFQQQEQAQQQQQVQQQSQAQQQGAQMVH
ncbi:peptidoglycan-binding protein [Dyella sp. BiH032]|uniref:XVIPCD domain-containing protein n=1 Tax=Dyella sp. BiH032 TaxID=3075430 RepID=UPI002892D9EB|nr:XVIPCD domain-containing protein [Dyella sp. BiH032]WNL45785.1 peptidoglycan-binding protein [Dyella sp. BiH032]